MTDKRIVRYALENGHPVEEISVWRQVAETTDVVVEGGATTLEGEAGLWRLLTISNALFAMAGLINKSSVEKAGMDIVSGADRYRVVKQGGEVLDTAFYNGLALPLREGVEVVTSEVYARTVRELFEAQLMIKLPDASEAAIAASDDRDKGAAPKQRKTTTRKPRARKGAS